jgi:multidrug resistance efflux pump
MKDWKAAESGGRSLRKKKGYEAVAEISGTVLSCNISIGEELAGGSGKVAVSIANLNDMVVDIQIDELDVGKIQAGMTASITVDDMDGQKFFTGEVISVSLEGKAENGVSFFGAGRIFEPRAL